ncbi:DDE-1 domain-containing protein [Caerostris extrusa]|uniref:DDE-1 domain-containing protein n=1 Tax=Caerostris extrusa TaxID=172846 RepID=A0AAV4Y202_CAEEX|nr:DDE-1 domain-containing protein [Caerostris extrusa]
MLTLIFPILFLAGNALSSPIANQYVDSLLNTALRNEIRALNLDPANLPDFRVDFYDKVAIIGKVKGKAEFSNGNLTGLSNARRFSECQGPYYSFGARSINCTITFDNLKIIYNAKLKYGKMPKVSIKGTADVVNTAIFIETSNQSPAMSTTLKNFLFTQIGTLNVKFTGLGPLNKFVKFLEDGFKSHVEAQIFNSMSQRYQQAINRAVGMIPFPN